MGATLQEGEGQKIIVPGGRKIQTMRLDDLITAVIVAFAASIASAPSPGFGNIFDGVEGRPLAVISQSSR
jgi:hypothetical protein